MERTTTQGYYISRQAMNNKKERGKWRRRSEEI
jgi:hypothetical protein